MSSLEIWGAVAGVIGVLNAIADIQDRRGQRRRKDARQREAAKHARFDRDQIRSTLDILYKDREIYERNIENTVDEQTKKIISELWAHIEQTVKRCRDITEQLRTAVDRERPHTDQIEACEKNLESSHRWLNHWLNLVKLNLNLDDRLNKQSSKTLPYRPPTPPSTPPPEEVVEYIKDDRLVQYVEDDDLAQIRNYIESCQGEPDFESRKATTLLLACRHRKKDLVSYCLSSDPNTEIEDDFGLGVLHNVIGSADFSAQRPAASEILDLLLDHGVDPSAADSTERTLTPLHRAADHGDLEAVKTLLSRAETPVNATDAQELTPLWSACTRPRPDMNVIKNIARKKGHFGDHEWPKASSEIIGLLVSEEVKGFEDFKE